MFVALLAHKYSEAGDYLVNVSAYNNLNSKSIQMTARVEQVLTDLQVQV